MKRLLIVLAFLLLAQPAMAAFSLKNSVSVPTNNSPYASTNLDTTGAKAVVFQIVYYREPNNQNSCINVSNQKVPVRPRDSLNSDESWAALGEVREPATGVSMSTWIGSGSGFAMGNDTFRIADTMYDCYVSFSVSAWNSDAASPTPGIPQVGLPQTSFGTELSLIQAGANTGGPLVLSFLGTAIGNCGGDCGFAIDSGFTKQETINETSAAHGLGMAYRIAAPATNPVWSWTRPPGIAIAMNVTLREVFATAGTLDVVASASCEYLEIQQDLSYLASAGTLNVAAGSCTWPTTLTIARGVNMLSPSVGTEERATLISFADPSDGIRIIATSTMTVKIDGFSFDGNDNTRTLFRSTGGTLNLIITHNTFKNGNPDGGAMHLSGRARGVIAKNVFDRTNVLVQVSGYNIPSADWGPGIQATLHFGDSDQLFFEDNTMKYSSYYPNSRNAVGWFETGQGSRAVLRFNNYDFSNVIGDTEYWDQHGWQSWLPYTWPPPPCPDQGISAGCIGQTGTTVYENYDNHIVSGHAAGRLTVHRGSKGIFFDNTFRGQYEANVNFTNQQYAGGCSSAMLGMSGLPQTLPFEFIPEINDTYYFHNIAGANLREMRGSYTPGAGSEVFFPGADGGGPNAPCGPIENGGPPTGLNAYPRGFWNYNASFNGTVGMGRGPGSPQTSTTYPGAPNCTMGVGWWRTDAGNWRTDGGHVANKDGEFWKCVSTNTWQLYYTPYTYPHPLVVNAPVTPSFTIAAHGSSAATSPTASSLASVVLNTTGAAAVFMAISQNACSLRLAPTDTLNSPTLWKTIAEVGQTTDPLQTRLFMMSGAAMQTGANHSFNTNNLTQTNSSCFASIAVLAVNLPSLVAGQPVIQVLTDYDNPLHVQAISAGPMNGAPLMLSVLGTGIANCGGNCGYAIDSGFQIVEQKNEGSNNAGLALAYKLHAEAGVDPVWSWTRALTGTPMAQAINAGFRDRVYPSDGPTVTSTTLPTAVVGTPYSYKLTATGGGEPYTWLLTLGALPAGLTLSSDGMITGTPTAAGTGSFTLNVFDALGQTSSQALSLLVNAAPVPPLTIQTTSLPAATVGHAYEYALAASGGVPPYNWTIASGALPAGLILSAAGMISGTPTTAGSPSFTVHVADSAAPANTTSESLTLTVNTPPVTLTITSTSPLPSGTVGTPYTYTFGAAGGTGPYTWTVTSGTLPTGLTLSSAGVLSGSPIAPTGKPIPRGSTTFTVQVTDSVSATASGVFELTMNDTPPLIITPPSTIPPLTVGTPFTLTLAVSGGLPPYTWSIDPETSDLLPPGLTLSNGVISGTPTADGHFDVTIDVTDSLGRTASLAMILTVTNTITPPGPGLTITQQPTNTVNGGAFQPAVAGQKIDTAVVKSLPLSRVDVLPQPQAAVSSYIAYTGTDVKPAPSVAPPAAANSTMTDPTFGTEILRVTDANTNGGQSYIPTDSGFHRTWNANSTRFQLTGPKGDGWWMEFNAATFKVGDGSATPKPRAVPSQYAQRWEWSAINPDIIYVLSGSSIVSYNVVTGAATTLASTPTGEATGYWAVVIGQDNWVCSAAGPAGNWVKIFCVEPLNTSVTKFIDVSAKTINGASAANQTDWPVGYSAIHSISGGTGDRWLEVTWSAAPWGTNGGSVFNLATNSWSLVRGPGQGGDIYGSGHVSMGKGVYANGAGNQGGQDSRGILLRNPDALSNSTYYRFIGQPSSPYNGWCDAEHTSWLNSGQNAAVPIIQSRYGGGTGCAYAWTREIIGISTAPGNNTVYRFAHNHSGCSYYGQAFAQVSNDGRFVLYSSYWDGQLGNTPGFDCSSRIDTFIAKLVSGDAPPTNPVLAFTQQPTATVSGSTITPAVAGSLTPAAAHSLTLSVNSGNCTLAGTLTVTANAATGAWSFPGVAVSDPSPPENCTLKVTDTTNTTVSPAISNSFNVTLTAPDTITMSVNSGTCQLAGTTTVPVQGSGWSFPGVTVTSNQTLPQSCTLRIHSSDTTTADILSNAFNVIANTPTLPVLSFQTQPQSTVSGTAMASFVVAVTGSLTGTVTLTTNGCGATFSPSDLQVALSGTTATFSGIVPARSGAGCTFTANASGATGATSNPFDVSDATTLSIITAATLPPATVGIPYSVSFAATGGTPPYSWIVNGALPSGLGFSNGVLSGTPTTATTTAGISFSASVTDSASNSANRRFGLTVNPATSPTPVILTTSLTPGTVGVAYSHILRAAGGQPPYSWLVTSGALPPGLTLSPSGIIAGVPTQATTPQRAAAPGQRAPPQAQTRTTQVTIGVTDSTSQTAVQPLALTITDPSTPGGGAGANGRVFGWCEDGNYPVQIPGGAGPSTNRFQRSFPNCTVTVFFAGSNTVAPIFSDGNGTVLANPFTAAASGRWAFYANTGSSYDIRLSGGGIPAPFTLGSVNPTAGGTVGGSNLANGPMSTADFNFPAQTPSGTLTAGAGASITMSPCPLGVAGTDPHHYLLVGNEAVLITGGTCAPGATSGTITFTPTVNHAAGFNVQSATAGCQEAVYSANPNGEIIFPRGTLNVYQSCYVDRPVLLRGQGEASTTLNVNSSGTAATAQNYYVFDVVTDSPVSLRDLSVFAAAPQTADGGAIRLAGTAIGNQHSRIDHITTFQVFNAFYSKSAAKWTLNASTFNQTENIGVFVDNAIGPDDGNAFITNNNILNNNGSAPATGSTFGNTGIFIQGGGGLRVIGNTVRSFNIGLAADPAPSSATGQLFIIGNSFDGYGTHGVLLTNTGAGVWNNILISTNFLASWLNGGEGVTVNGTNIYNGVIANNTFERYNPTVNLVGVKIALGQFFQIHDNLFTGMNIGIENFNAGNHTTIGKNVFNGTVLANVSNHGDVTTDMRFSGEPNDTLLTSAGYVPSLAVTGAGAAGSMAVLQDTPIAGGATLILGTNGASAPTDHSQAPAGGVGQLLFDASDGTGYSQVASIQGTADAVPSVGNTPGTLNFWTTPAGSSTPVRRMELTANGGLVVGTPTGYTQGTGTVNSQGFFVNGASFSGTINVRNAANTGACTITVTGGIITATTCQ